jgi:DNA-binding winged helix-turn-helix (wHTH) protein/TolB-like protein
VNDKLQSGVRIGDWEVYPQENLLKGPDRECVLEPKVMDVLVFLACRQGEVVSREQLLDAVWADVVVGDENVSRAIYVLRLELGDDQKFPHYLKTISKRGYRLIADVIPMASGESHEADPDAPSSAGLIRPSTLFSELKRRNVLRVAIAYGIVAWFLIEVTATTFPVLVLPGWTVTLITVLLFVGFPVALLFAWAFELTPEGIKREKEVDRSRSITSQTGKRLDRMIIVVLMLALGTFAIDKFVLDPARDVAREEATAERVRGEVLAEYLGDNSAAVLQFKNLSDDKEAFQYVVDAFYEELVISLEQASNLKLVRGPELSDARTAKKIAEELGVNDLVRGSLRTDGDKIRITIELTDTDGFLTWTGRFDGAAGDIFNLQEKVATEIRDAIYGEKGEQIRAKSRPANYEAFDKNMRGLSLLAKRDLESLQRAEIMFRETTQLNPNFGPAYLRLAMTLLLLAEYNVPERRQIFQQAIEVADQGVQADPSIRAPMAIIYGFVDHQLGNWTAAMDSFETAFQGVTVYPITYHWHSRLLGALGQLEKSRQQAIAGLRLEPASQTLNSRVAISYFWVNKMENAQYYFEEANSFGDGATIHNFAYTLFLIRDDRFEEARTRVKFAVSLLRADNWWVDPVIDGLADRGNQDLAEIALETIDKMIADGWASLYHDDVMCFI